MTNPLRVGAKVIFLYNKSKILGKVVSKKSKHNIKGVTEYTISTRLADQDLEYLVQEKDIIEVLDVR